jgi:DNA repair protein RadD
MSFILRDYQEAGTQASVDILQSSKKTCKELVISPTAGGKSIYVAETVKRVNAPILILQPSKELLLQNYEKFIKVGGTASICCASLKVKTEKGVDFTQLDNGDFVECRKISKVTYATVGTVKKYAEELKKLGVTKAIIDEAHLSTKVGSKVRELFKEIGITHVVGLTATALYLEGGMNGATLKMMNRTRAKMFTDIRYVTQISELVKAEPKSYWSKLLYQVNDTDETYLEENSNGSDFTVQSQKDYYKANNLQEQIVEEVKNMIVQGRKSILVFVPTIDEANELYKTFPNSAVVHSKIDTGTRDYVIKAFKDLTIPVVFNVNVLSVGFDHPELDGIITARSTASIALFYQQIGRGVRIHDKKKDCKVVDFSGNVKRFGRVEGLHYENLPYYGWGLFNDRNELLTDFPISGGTRPTKESLMESGKKEVDKNKVVKENPEFTFGMFKGKKLWDVAQGKDAERLKSYCSWLYDKHLKNEWSFYGPAGEALKRGIIEYLRVPKQAPKVTNGLPF